MPNRFARGDVTFFITNSLLQITSRFLFRDVKWGGAGRMYAAPSR